MKMNLKLNFLLLLALGNIFTSLLDVADSYQFYIFTNVQPIILYTYEI